MTNNISNYVLLAEVLMATKDEKEEKQKRWAKIGWKALWIYIVLGFAFNIIRFLIQRGG